MSQTKSVGAPADTPVGLPNCGVVSTAIICGWDHKTAWETLKRYTKGNGRGWRGRTYDHHREQVLSSAGVGFETKTYLRNHRYRPQPTLAQWLRSDDYDPAATYELTITGHVMVLHRGVLFDQSHRQGIPVHQYKRKRARVCVARRITSGSPLVE